jgi:hypothetical protein
LKIDAFILRKGRKGKKECDKYGIKQAFHAISFFISKQSIFLEEIEWGKLTKLFFELFVTHLYLLSHVFLAERKIGRKQLK